MKPEEFKKIIKESVKEAINESLKEILLEAIKSPKGIVNENYSQSTVQNKKTLTPKERQEMFGGLLGDMQNGIPANTQQFTPASPDAAINGTLPPGEVSLDQIANLLKI